MFFQKTVLYKGGGQDDRVMAPKLSSEELQPVKRIWIAEWLIQTLPSGFIGLSSATLDGLEPYSLEDHV